VLLASGLDGRAIVALAEVGAFVCYTALAVGWSWLHPSERVRWKYRRHHVGSGSLLPALPTEPDALMDMRRFYWLSLIAAVAALVGGYLLITLVAVGAGLAVFLVGSGVSAYFRFNFLTARGFTGARG
jgi:hypothetical protein